MPATLKGGPIAHRIESDEHDIALQRLFSRIGQMSSLPGVAQRVLQVAGDDDSNTDDLLEVVEQDPILAIRIMRTVNSSFFGLRVQIAELSGAISMLGFVEVRNLALTVCVARLCETPSSYRDYSREKLWRHMVTVGTIARVVARICKRSDPNEAYLAGLLHDVGMLMIDQYMHQQFCEVLDLVYDGMPTTEAERQVLTFDHTDLGAYVSRESNFPDRMTTAIRYHHRPCDYHGRDRDLLDVVAMANYFASRSGVFSLGTANISPPSNKVCVALGLQERHLKAIWDEMEPALEAANTLAKI